MELLEICFALVLGGIIYFFQDDILLLKQRLLFFFWDMFGERTRLFGIALFLGGPVVIVLTYNIGAAMPMLVWFPVMAAGLLVTFLGGFVIFSSPQ
jgi:hypothetical protein